MSIQLDEENETGKGHGVMTWHGLWSAEHSDGSPSSSSLRPGFKSHAQFWRKYVTPPDFTI